MLGADAASGGVFLSGFAVVRHAYLRLSDNTVAGAINLQGVHGVIYPNLGLYDQTVIDIGVAIISGGAIPGAKLIEDNKVIVGESPR